MARRCRRRRPDQRARVHVALGDDASERRGDAKLKSPEKIDAFIKRADANGDGAVDKAELQATRKARAAPPPAEN